MTLSIALCTYNGSRYLRGQLESLPGKLLMPCELVVCDDSSIDNTLAIISDFAHEAQFPVYVHEGLNNLGPVKNFEKAIRLCRGEYIALCDQDDVWLPGKMEKALRKIKALEDTFGKTTPILIHTDARVVDSDLAPIDDSLWRFQRTCPRKGKDLNRLLLQNIATGCTVVFNKALKDLALPIPENAMMHDWWLALTASAFGRIDHILEPTVLYRQHVANETGAKKWNLFFAICHFSKILRDEKEVSGEIRGQAEAFMRQFAERLSESQQKLLSAFIDLPNQNYFKRKFNYFKYRFYYTDWLRTVARFALR